jgi:glycine dehydrogenase
VRDYGAFFAEAHGAGAFCIVAADLLSLALLRPPGEFGADVAVGSSQRFGVPPGFGGPHAGFLATRDAFKRQMPGRLVGVSKDAQGDPAMRLALGTREQHIRRDKATSNICTAQVLLAVMASMYAVYHGPAGIRRIARRTKLLTEMLAAGLRAAGAKLGDEPFFDTLTVGNVAPERVHAAAEAKGFNLRRIDGDRVGISLDEATTVEEVRALLAIFGGVPLPDTGAVSPDFAPPHARTTPFLTASVFQRYHTEHEMLRYIKRLEAKDLTLCQSMISLGSCTMKLNAASELFPVSWPEFSRLHPFAPGGADPRLQEAFPGPRGLARRDHGIRRGLAPAERRLPGGVRRPARRARLQRVPRRGPPQRVPHPDERARDQPGERGHVRLRGRPGRVRRAGQHRRRRPEGQGEAHRGTSRP